MILPSEPSLHDWRYEEACILQDSRDFNKEIAWHDVDTMPITEFSEYMGETLADALEKPEHCAVFNGLLARIARNEEMEGTAVALQTFLNNIIDDRIEKELDRKRYRW